MRMSYPQALFEKGLIEMPCSMRSTRAVRAGPDKTERRGSQTRMTQCVEKTGDMTDSTVPGRGWMAVDSLAPCLAFQTLQEGIEQVIHNLCTRLHTRKEALPWH